MTKLLVKAHGGVMQDVEVIESAEAAAAALDPARARLLGELAVPASAAGLAARVGIARQKVNYHLKELEARDWSAKSRRAAPATSSKRSTRPSRARSS